MKRTNERNSMLRLALAASMLAATVAQESQKDSQENQMDLTDDSSNSLVMSKATQVAVSALLTAGTTAFFASEQPTPLTSVVNRFSEWAGNLTGRILGKRAAEEVDSSPAEADDDSIKQPLKRSRITSALEPKQIFSELPSHTINGATYQILNTIIPPNGLEIVLKTTFPNGTAVNTTLNEDHAGKQEAQDWEIVSDEFAVIVGVSNDPNFNGTTLPIMNVVNLSNQSKLNITTNGNLTRTESKLVPDFFGNIPFTPASVSIELPTTRQDGVDYEPNQFQATLRGANGEQTSKTFVIENNQCRATEQFLTKPSQTPSISQTNSLSQSNSRSTTRTPSKSRSNSGSTTSSGSTTTTRTPSTSQSSPKSKTSSITTTQTNTDSASTSTTPSYSGPLTRSRTSSQTPSSSKSSSVSAEPSPSPETSRGKKRNNESLGATAAAAAVGGTAGVVAGALALRQLKKTRAKNPNGSKLETDMTNHRL
ncbi:MAG: hypothetical protein V4612_05670 [Pseudomonadota bacterium]